MKNIRDIGLIFLLIIALVLIRAYASFLFYDPLWLFFKTIHTTLPLPELNKPALIASMSLRYGLNSVISVLILALIFKDKSVIKFSLAVYVLFYVIIISVFYTLLLSKAEGPHMPLFYVRRFIVHPLLLLLLIPALYFRSFKE